jgi:hypothetical protein
VKTYSRSLDWKDSKTLIVHDIQETRSLRSGLAFIQVNFEEIRKQSYDRGQYERLFSDIERILNRTPEGNGKAEMWYFRGVIASEIKNVPEARIVPAGHPFESCTAHDREIIFLW